MSEKKKNLAHWMQVEHARVEELIYQARRFLAVPPMPQREAWLRDARECLARLCEHYRKHMQLEEQGGYMREALELRPTLSRLSDPLLHEHRELDLLMTHLQRLTEALTPADNLLIRHTCVQISTFLSYVERHNEQENQLVLLAFTEDIGSPD